MFYIIILCVIQRHLRDICMDLPWGTRRLAKGMAELDETRVKRCRASPVESNIVDTRKKE